MTYLLDTNVVSELRRPETANPDVKAFAAAHSAEQFFLSAISVLELETGVLRVERRDARRGERLRRWLERKVLLPFDGRILPFDAEAARCWARLHVPDRLPERDAMIAATALVRGLVVVTRNPKDFEATGVRLLNPWR